MMAAMVDDDEESSEDEDFIDEGEEEEYLFSPLYLYSLSRLSYLILLSILFYNHNLSPPF